MYHPQWCAPEREGHTYRGKEGNVDVEILRLRYNNCIVHVYLMWHVHVSEKNFFLI